MRDSQPDHDLPNLQKEIESEEAKGQILFPLVDSKQYPRYERRNHL